MADRFPTDIPSGISKGQFDARTGFGLDLWMKSVQEGMGGLQGTPDDPSEIQAGVAADPGASQAAAPSDHVHSVDTAIPGVPIALGGPASEGTGTALMRADAVNYLGQGGAVANDALVSDGSDWVPGLIEGATLGIGTTRYDTLIYNGTIWERKRYAPTPVGLVTAQLPAATGVLYTAAASVVIRSFRLVNTSAAPRTVNLYVRPGGAGTRYPIMPYNTVIAAGAQYSTDPAALFIPLSATDTIEGDSDVAAVVDCSVDGEAYLDYVETASRVYAGLAPNALTTLATVPASTRWVVKYIGVVNVSGGAVTLDLRIVRGGTTAKIINVSIPATAMVNPQAYFVTLEAGDTIAAVAGAAASISVVVGAAVTVA